MMTEDEKLKTSEQMKEEINLLKNQLSVISDQVNLRDIGFFRQQVLINQERQSNSLERIATALEESIKTKK